LGLALASGAGAGLPLEPPPLQAPNNAGTARASAMRARLMFVCRLTSRQCPPERSCIRPDYAGPIAGTALGVGERDADAGFTLIEVLLATALFVVVAFAGFDVVRQLSASVALMAQRADAATQLGLAAAEIRSDALSALAVWKPASTCGDAVEFMQRDAGGTTFALYERSAGALVRATAAGPMNPCDDALQRRIVVPSVAGFTVTPLPAATLATHADPISGNADGAIFMPAGLTGVSVSSHASDVDGTPIATGNESVEVLLDADPVVTPVDLVAGNRPSAYTQVLSYACNGRCEANGPFPEIRGGTFDDCTPGDDFQHTAAYYVPATYGTIVTGTLARIVVTSYTVAGAYTFTFGGPAPLTLERAWPVAVWPPPGSALAGTIADPYPVDYAANAIRTRGVTQLAADLGEPAAFAAALSACSDMHADPTFHE
jgi:prepilin-type N-terminal cleavage/methylation domain-containing protein